MKTELSTSGFREIPTREQQEINGGVIPFLLRIAAGLVIAAGTAIIEDWDNFKNGLQGLPEE